MSASYMLASQSNGKTYPPLPAVLDDADVSLIARTDASVLFTGRAHVRTLAIKIHGLTGAGAGTFRAVDCGAAAPVLETELFGVLEQGAARGTLFLHEVGKLPTAAQARLRDLIARSATAEHASRGRRRIIASTSDPLLPRVVDGTFDDRLFYLLNVMHFDVRQI